MIFVRDRVKQGTTTNGAGTISLTSSFGGFQGFSVLGNNSQTFYAIEESTNWEVGIGTYSGTTLTRDTVLDSASGAGVPIYLSGSAVVFVTYPASGSVFSTGSIVLATGIKLGSSGIAFSDGTAQTTAGATVANLASTGNTLSANLVSTGNSLGVRISTIETTGVATAANLASTGGTLYTNSVTTGNVLNTRISTIESTGVATAANLLATGATNASGIVVDRARLTTIESTGVATAANLLATGATNAAAIAAVTPFSLASGARVDLNTTNLASTGSTLYVNSVTTGNVLGSRISTIEGSGTLTGLGSAPSTNIKKLALWDGTDGLTFDSNLTFNTNLDELVLGVSGVRFADASNQNTAFENWSLIVSNPDQEYYNYVSASSNTVGSGAGVDFTGVNGIYTTGQLISSKRHKVTISGVAGSTSQVGVLQLQDSVDTSTTKAVTPNAVRVVSGDLQSQIAGGGTTYTAGSGLTLVGTEFNTTGTGRFDQITFTNQNWNPASSNIRIGKEAGDGNNDQSPIFIGDQAGKNSDTPAGIIVIGWEAAQGASGSSYSQLIGAAAGNYATGVNYSNVIGFNAGNQIKRVTGSDVIGRYAGYQAQDISNSVIIGRNAAELSNVVHNSTIIGYRAGKKSVSGNNNYIGPYAGYYATGTGNIEILTDGSVSENVHSILGKNDNKIHINRTIIGDTSSKKLAIGDVGASNLSPDATLEIIPKATSDVGLIVQRNGGSADLTVWQTGTLDVASVNSTGAISGAHYEFGDGTIQTTAAIGMSAASGAKIDANTTGIYNTSGNLNTRISTIESTGVATAANLASTGGTLNSNLISTGNALFTGLYNTSGNLAALIPTEPVACRLTTTQGTVVADEVATQAVFDVIDYEYGNISGSIHPASASGRITLQETGVYHINAGVAYAGFTQLGNWGLGVYKNGNIALPTSSGDSVVTWATDYTETSFGGNRRNNINTVVTGTSGDYFEIYLWNENAGNSTRTSTANSTWFSVTKLDGTKGDKGDTGSTGPAGGDYSFRVSGTGTPYSDIYNSNVIQITGAGDTSVTFTSGTPNVFSVSTTLSATTGAQIDSNSSRLSTIESTGVATAANLASTGGTLYSNSVTTGNVLHSRISTIESTGVATAANLLATGATNASGIVADRARLTTIESTGVATAANLLSTGATNAANISSGLARISTIESTGVATAANLASTGGTLYSNSVTTGNVLHSRISTIESTGVATAANLLSTGATNAAAIAAVTPFSLASGARVDLNTTNLASTGSTLYVNSVTTGNVLNTRISTIESTGVATAANLLSTGATNAANISSGLARISTIESTGVATAANLASTGGTLYTNSVTTGNVLNTRISTIESTGVATAANLLATGATNASGIVVDRARLTTIESTGVATAANLLSTGATNAAAIAAVTPFSLASGARVDLNTTNLASTGSTLYVNSVTTGNVLNTRISTIESTGVATAANLASTGGTLYTNSVTTGNVLNTRISTIESTGVATAANLASTGGTLYTNSVTTGNVLNTRISTIESTGVATSANLIATGAVVQDGHQDINVSIATASGFVSPMISGNSTSVTNLDLSLGSNFNYKLAANTTFQVKNVTKGQKFTLRTEQDGTASRSVTFAFGSDVRWAEGGTAATGTEYPAGVADYYGFTALETGLFMGFVIGNNIK